jgi:hypothetical protein
MLCKVILATVLVVPRPAYYLELNWDRRRIETIRGESKVDKDLLSVDEFLGDNSHG